MSGEGTSTNVRYIVPTLAVIAALGAGYYFWSRPLPASSSSKAQARPPKLEKPTEGSSGNLRGPLTTPPTTPTTSVAQPLEPVAVAESFGSKDEEAPEMPVQRLKALWELLPKTADGMVSKGNLTKAIKLAPHEWGPLLGADKVNCVNPAHKPQHRKPSKFAIDWASRLANDIDLNRDGFIGFNELLSYSIEHGWDL